MEIKKLTDEELKKSVKRLFEESKTQEELFCPLCGTKLIVQRSKDWCRLYGLYCKNCEFIIKT